MLPQTTKKVAKLLPRLITISFLLISFSSFSQLDTAKFHKEINQVLKKYGLKESPFYMMVKSINQKGGQTAYEINNYNGKELIVFNAPAQIGNSNTQNIFGSLPRVVKREDLESFFIQIHDKSIHIDFTFIGLSATAECLVLVWLYTKTFVK